MIITLAFLRGCNWDNFFAAASIELAAVRSSFSAMTVGSSGSTQSVPTNTQRKYGDNNKPMIVIRCMDLIPHLVKK